MTSVKSFVTYHGIARVITESSGRLFCNLLKFRLARDRPLESRFARLGLLEMHLARVNLLESRLARLAKRYSGRNSLVKRKTDRNSLVKRKTDRNSLVKRKTDRNSLAKRYSGRSLPRQTQKRQKLGGRPVKSDNLFSAMYTPCSYSPHSRVTAQLLSAAPFEFDASLGQARRGGQVVANVCRAAVACRLLYQCGKLCWNWPQCGNTLCTAPNLSKSICAVAILGELASY